MSQERPQFDYEIQYASRPELSGIGRPVDNIRDFPLRYERFQVP